MSKKWTQYKEFAWPVFGIFLFLATFDRVFEPSSKSEEADWFVLDENGTRQLNLEIENHATSPEERIDEVESGIETEYEDSTERKVFGDFEPIIGPIQ